MEIDDANETGRRSLPSLIGWLSLCLLAAAWGPPLDATMRQIWAIVGLFGLASAIGLDIVRGARLVRRRRKQRLVTQRHIDRSLTRLAARNATIKEVNAALGRIVEDNQQHSTAYSGLRSEPRLSFHRRVQLKPLSRIEGPSINNGGKSLTAFIRDISASGVGLVHDQPVDSRRVALTFDLLDGASITFVVDLQWHRRQADGKYSSGGKIIEVIAPASASMPVTAETA